MIGDAGTEKDPLTIGGTIDPGEAVSDYPVKGAIDEVEYFDQALTLDQITAIYQAGSLGKCKAMGCIERDLDGFASPGNGLCRCQDSLGHDHESALLRGTFDK